MGTNKKQNKTTTTTTTATKIGEGVQMSSKLEAKLERTALFTEETGNSQKSIHETTL